MAKTMLSTRIDEELRYSLSLEAAEKGRSVTNMLEWILRERYGDVSQTVVVRDWAGRVAEEIEVPAALTERGGSGENGAADKALRPIATDPGVHASRSVSADVAATVGTVEEDALIADTAERAKRLSFRDGRCTADVAHGTKCKLCGKVH